MIKTFEAFKQEPKVGDYVICALNHTYNSRLEEYINFISVNIGRVIKINLNTQFKFKVKYNDTDYQKSRNPNNPNYPNNPSNWSLKGILFFSSNKEEMEIIIQANKYNL